MVYVLALCFFDVRQSIYGFELHRSCEGSLIFDRPVGLTGRMPLARYESIDESLKTRILDVSKDEFSAHGFEGAS